MSIRSQRIRDVQHFGEEGGVVPVVDVAATSTFLNPENMTRAFRGEMPGCYLYSRHSNPSVQIFSQKIAAMENTESALGVASGMAAIAASIEALAQAGDHIVCSQVVYGGTYAFFKNLLPRRGISVSFVDFDNPQAVEAAITQKTRVLYTETMSNPLLSIADFEALKRIKAKHSYLKLVVDNTFTPIIVAPAELGADVVIHSCTKYISGASDMVAGVIAADQNFINSLIDVNNGPVMLMGPVMDARLAHELYMRMDHLPVRIKAHSKAALHLAHKAQEAGAKVIYPGLKEHPHHEKLRKIMDSEFGFGGMLVIDCGDSEKALKMASRLQDEKFGLYAVSLGFSRTLMSCPALSTSSEMTEDDMKKINLHSGLLRLSIGYMGDDEIMSDRFIKVFKEVMK